MLLANYAGCDTKSLSEAQNWILENVSGEMSRSDLGKSFHYSANICKMNSVTLLWSQCSAEHIINSPPHGFVQKLFQISGKGLVSADGKKKKNDAAGACLFVPAEVTTIQENSADSEHLTLGIQLDAIKSKIAALCGQDVLHFELLNPGLGEVLLLRNAVFSFAHELDLIGPRLSLVALEEMEQSIIVKFLLLHKNSHSQFLMQPSLDSGERMTTMVDEYIRANWDRPHIVEDLSKLTDVSVRSLYRTFKKKWGVTPSERLKQVRLENARNMLLTGGRDRSVMQIGLKCGFQSLGHFSRDYRATYGELPSATLRRSK